MTTDSFREHLRDELLKRCKKNPSYSLRAFATSLGLNHALLSMILRGKRRVTPELVLKAGAALGLSPKRIEAFASASGARFSDATSRSEKIREMNRLTLDAFSLVTEWYHDAILELSRTKGFVGAALHISRMLGISGAEAQAAIDRLSRLGLIEVGVDGKWKETGHFSTIEHSDLTSAALRAFQKKILELSSQSLSQVPKELRDHTCITMAVRKRDLAEAKERIKAFRRGLAANFASVALRLTDALESLCPEASHLQACIRFPEVREAADRMKVTAEESIVPGPDGKPRDAVNDRSKEIVVSKASWTKISNAPDARERRLRLAAHELFSISGLDDSDNFTHSTPVVELLKRNTSLFTEVAGSYSNPENSDPCSQDEYVDAKKKLTANPAKAHFYCREKCDGKETIKALLSGRIDGRSLSDFINLYQSNMTARLTSIVSDGGELSGATILTFELLDNFDFKNVYVATSQNGRLQDVLDETLARQGYSPELKGSATIYQKEVAVTVYSHP